MHQEQKLKKQPYQYLGGEHTVTARLSQLAITSCKKKRSKTARPQTNACKLPQDFSSGALGIIW